MKTWNYTIIQTHNTFVLRFHHKTEKICKFLIKNFNSTQKKDVSASKSEASENVYLFESVS